MKHDDDNIDKIIFHMDITLLSSRIEVNTKIGMSKQHLKRKGRHQHEFYLHISPFDYFSLPQYISCVFKIARNNIYFYCRTIMINYIIGTHILSKYGHVIHTWSMCNVRELICMYVEELSKYITNILEHNNLYIFFINHTRG
jgi:hypothetical protein